MKVVFKVQRILHFVTETDALLTDSFLPGFTARQHLPESCRSGNAGAMAIKTSGKPGVEDGAAIRRKEIGSLNERKESLSPIRQTCFDFM